MLMQWWVCPCRDEIDFVDDAFLFATYDPPQQLINRYNEVIPLTCYYRDNRGFVSLPIHTVTCFLGPFFFL
jgi:hypothetical protein